MPAHNLHQKKKYLSINIKMTADPLVYNQKGHRAAEREEVSLHFCMCLDKKTFSGLFYLHFFPVGFVLWSHSLLPESRQVFLPIPLILLSKPENTTSPKVRIPHLLQDPQTPVTRVLILIVQPLEMRRRPAWWEPLEFTGICFKSSLGNNCLVDWKLIALLKGWSSFWE